MPKNMRLSFDQPDQEARGQRQDIASSLRITVELTAKRGNFPARLDRLSVGQPVVFF